MSIKVRILKPIKLSLSSYYKPLFTFLLISCPFLSYSQFLAAGYRSHFGGMEEFKNVVNFYNDNRPWLDKEMNNSAYMHGFEIGLGGSRGKFGYTLGRFYAQFGKTRASGSNNGMDYERSITTRIYGVEIIDAWYTPIHVKGYNIGLGVMPIGLGFLRVKTTLNGETKKLPLTDFYTGILSSSHMYLNLHFDVTKVTENDHSWQFQLFYSIGPKQEYELLYLNREINPNTFDQIGRRTVMKINNWGLKLMYSH